MLERQEVKGVATLDTTGAERFGETGRGQSCGIDGRSSC
jgi:hypothetical protein